MNVPVSEYRTLSSSSIAVFREKMSRFIAIAEPVMSAAEAKARIAAIANKYHDARHVCWAYMLGADCKEYLSSDNGEPSGTAGKPILGQIRSAGLTNVMVAVVRYFGGIKLGTSGLIAAYREAARQAIDAGETVTDYERSRLTVTFPYIAMNEVMRVVKTADVRVLSQKFDNSCLIVLEVRRDQADGLCKRMDDLDGTSTELDNSIDK